MAVGEDGAVWVSKPPTNLPTILNIIGIFDTMSWGCILVSIVVAIITLSVITWHEYIFYANF